MNDCCRRFENVSAEPLVIKEIRKMNNQTERMKLVSTPTKGTKLRLLRALLSISLAVLPPVVDSFARPSSVFNIADGDVAGLIAAIKAANTNPGPDIINLAPGGTYTLTTVADDDGTYYGGPTGLPWILSQITIN